MGPGPYGDGGSRKYMLGQPGRQSPSPRARERGHLLFAPVGPRDPARGDHGRARHRGPLGQGPLRRDLQLPAEATREAAALLSDLGCPLLIHQPAYSMLNRWPERGLLDAIDEVGAGCIVYSPLEQGILTDRYLSGVPDGSRASREDTLSSAQLDPRTLSVVRALGEVAARRGQTIAQMALAWTQRDPVGDLDPGGSEQPRPARAERGDRRLARLHARGVAGDRRDPPPRLTGRTRHRRGSGR